MKQAMWSVAAAMVFMTACGQGSGGNTGGGGNASAGGGTGATGGGGTSATGGGGNAVWVPCSASNKCPSGQFCFNGLCAIGCLSANDCAANQYCDTSKFGDQLCHDKVVPTCPEAACASSQVCSNGLCSTPPPATQCTVGQAADGCDKYSVCANNSNNQPQCFSLPACPENGVCPTGLIGEVCNNGLVPEKARVCLIGLCAQDTNCPAANHCVTTLGAFGMCSSGQLGAICSKPEHCAAGLNCQQGLPGTPGVCAP